MHSIYQLNNCEAQQLNNLTTAKILHQADKMCPFEKNVGLLCHEAVVFVVRMNKAFIIGAGGLFFVVRIAKK